MCGYEAKWECFNPREQPSPKATPVAIETKKENRKIPTPWKREER
jgi:hypothetical protein